MLTPSQQIAKLVAEEAKAKGMPESIADDLQNSLTEGNPEKTIQRNIEAWVRTISSDANAVEGENS